MQTQSHSLNFYLQILLLRIFMNEGDTWDYSEVSEETSSRQWEGSCTVVGMANKSRHGLKCEKHTQTHVYAD